MGIHTDISGLDTTNYFAAVASAERRALHSYFNQHVVEEEGHYYSFDEGDYNALPQHVAERIVLSVPGALADDY